MRKAVVVAPVLAAASCFQVEPLPDCAETSGLYARHHVCMPLAGPPLALSAPPRQLVLGDFDDEGVDNDLAVLVDDLRVQVFAGIDLEDPALSAELAFTGGRVQSIRASRFYQKGEFGEDILAIVSPGSVTPGSSSRLAGARNGGDLFADGVVENISLQAPVEGSLLAGERDCLQPNSLESVFAPDEGAAKVLVVACRSAPSEEAVEDGPLDGLLVLNWAESLGFGMRKGFTSDYADVHGLATAPLDGFGFDDLVFVHRRAGAEHDDLAVVLFSEGFNLGGYVDIALAHAEVDGVISADVDDDGDVDLVAIHPSSRGVSVIRQRRSDPLQFEEPQYFGLGYEIRDAAVGDFTGDGATDIAVAHGVEGTGVDGLSVLVRLPDLLPGTTEYVPVQAAMIPGTIVDLETLDFDDDGRVDLAASVRQGSGGSVRVFLNRSPAVRE